MLLLHKLYKWKLLGSVNIVLEKNYLCLGNGRTKNSPSPSCLVVTGVFFIKKGQLKEKLFCWFTTMH